MRICWSHILALLLVALVWFIGALGALQSPMWGDEWVHFQQSRELVRGYYRIYDEILTTFPGWNVFVAGWMKLFGSESLWVARLINTIAAGCAVALFARLAQRAHGEHSVLRIAQFALLPCAIVYFFKVFTDPPSLALVLAGFVAAIDRQYWRAGLWLLLSMTVRQNNVFWLLAACAYAIWSAHPTRMELVALRWRAWLRDIPWRIVVPFLPGILAFALYWWWRGSISFSPPQSKSIHPDFFFSLGNPLFGLFLLGVLMPFHALRAALAAIKAPRAMWRLWLAVFAALILYVFAFELSNKLNTDLVHVDLRNTLLRASRDIGWVRVLFGAFVCAGALVVANTKLKILHPLVWAGAVTLFLGSSSLIEQRYLMIPMALWLALRVHEQRRLELATLSWWGGLCLVLLAGIDARWFAI